VAGGPREERPVPGTFPVRPHGRRIGTVQGERRAIVRLPSRRGDGEA